MRKIVFLLLPAFLFLFACLPSEVFFYVDEKYYEAFEGVASPFKVLSGVCKEQGLKAKMEKVVVTHLEPDFTAKIQDQKGAKLIILSPYLAKKASLYAAAMPDRLFVKMESLGRSEAQNVICLYRHREPFFQELAQEVYQYQRGGLKVGAGFYIGDTRRNQEKNLFLSELQALNQNNYPLVTVTAYKVDNIRTAQEISSTMLREEVDYLLLFSSLLNYDVLENLAPVSKKIKVITESIYPQDQIYKERIYYSVNNDYDAAFKSLIALYLEFKKEGSLPSGKQDIALPVKRFHFSDPIPLTLPADEEEIVKTSEEMPEAEGEVGIFKGGEALGKEENPSSE